MDKRGGVVNKLLEFIDQSELQVVKLQSLPHFEVRHHARWPEEDLVTLDQSEKAHRRKFAFEDRQCNLIHSETIV